MSRLWTGQRVLAYAILALWAFTVVAAFRDRGIDNDVVDSASIRLVQQELYLLPVIALILLVTSWGRRST